MRTGRGTIEVHLEPGQFIFGRKSAAKELGIPESSVRNRMKKLKNMQNVDIKEDSQYSIISVINWGSYQAIEKKEDSQKDNQRTTKGQSKDTDKNVENVEKGTIKESAFDLNGNFEKAWFAYPVKKGRKEAMNHYRASVKDEATANRFMAALENYTLHIKEYKKEKFIMNGATFFNNWQDEVWQTAPAKQKRGLVC